LPAVPQRALLLLLALLLFCRARSILRAGRETQPLWKRTHGFESACAQRLYWHRKEREMHRNTQLKIITMSSDRMQKWQRKRKTSMQEEERKQEKKREAIWAKMEGERCAPDGS